LIMTLRSAERSMARVRKLKGRLINGVPSSPVADDRMSDAPSRSSWRAS
jgi:hypothetical protein